MHSSTYRLACTWCCIIFVSSYSTSLKFWLLSNTNNNWTRSLNHYMYECCWCCLATKTLNWITWNGMAGDKDRLWHWVTIEQVSCNLQMKQHEPIRLMMFCLGDYGAKAVSLLSADGVITSTPSRITHMTHKKTIQWKYTLHIVPV